jgi:hypothetical protein
MPDYTFGCTAEQNSFQSAVPTRSQNDEVSINFASELADFLEWPARKKMTLLRRKFQPMLMLDVCESVLEVGNAVVIIADYVAGTFDRHRFMVGSYMDWMHNSAELLGNHDCVIQHPQGFT